MQQLGMQTADFISGQQHVVALSNQNQKNPRMVLDQALSYSRKKPVNDGLKKSKKGIEAGVRLNMSHSGEGSGPSLALGTTSDFHSARDTDTGYKLSHSLDSSCQWL